LQQTLAVGPVHVHSVQMTARVIMCSTQDYKQAGEEVLRIVPGEGESITWAVHLFETCRSALEFKVD
jgi:hypothetical protein